MVEIILYIIIGIIIFEFGLERVLDVLNRKSRKTTLPKDLEGIYDEEKYEKSQKYANAKDKLSDFSGALSLVVTLAILIFGGFGWLDAQVSQITDNLILATLLFFGIVGLGADIMGTPFEIYNTFVIEEKFGFNKMSFKLYLTDKIKGWLVSIVIGGILLSAFVWFYATFREQFWIYAWAIFMSFSLLAMMFYTNLFMPLFNKLVPLEDGELRQKIEEYSNKVNFPVKNIMVMDGSKRSTKANAFFSGLGKSKNIVLFDTLIEKHSIEELVAILAHEVGHYKKKHTLQGLFISAVTMLLTLFLLHLVIDTPELSLALGASEPKLYLGMVAFSILYSPLSTITGVLMNLFSRKNEYEADAYAANTSSSEALVTALKKLSVDNLTNLTPHPSFVFFYYSHPTLLQRMNALFKLKAS